MNRTIPMFSMKKRLKYLLITLFAVASFSGYMYVEYEPFSPMQRIQKLRKTSTGDPIADAYVLWKSEKGMKHGDPFSMANHWIINEKRGNEAGMQKAIELLQGHESNTAKFYAYTIPSGMFSQGFSGFDAEALYLFIRTGEEKLRPYGMSDADYYQWYGRDSDKISFTDWVYMRADEGQKRERQVVEMLEAA